MPADRAAATCRGDRRPARLHPPINSIARNSAYTLAIPWAQLVWRLIEFRSRYQWVFQFMGTPLSLLGCADHRDYASSLRNSPVSGDLPNCSAGAGSQGAAQVVRWRSPRGGEHSRHPAIPVRRPTADLIVIVGMLATVNSTLAIETSGLTKRYGARLAVGNLDLAVRQGEIFGFLGP